MITKETAWKLFVFAFFVGAVIGAITSKAFWFIEGERHIQTEAVKAKVAGYSSDPDGRPAFKWCGCAALGVKNGCGQ